MNPLEYLGKKFLCECGRTHYIPIKKIIYKSGILDSICECVQDILTKPANIAIIADERTFEVAGRYVEKSFLKNHIGVYSIRLKDPAKDIEPICDEPTKEYIRRQLRAGTELMVACGSGVISDLTKWISLETKIPYLMVPTAASMNGYASSNIAPLIGGIKRLMEGTTPLAIIADEKVICEAPLILTLSGLGDVIAKPVSTTDWRLNNLLFNDYFCEFCVNLIKEQEKVYMTNSIALKHRDPKAVEALFFALIFSGIAMTITETSAPASGGEHLISHTLDMLAIRDGNKHDYHGRQVGIGTIFASALYEKIFEIEKPTFKYPDGEIDKHYWKSLSSTVQLEFLKKKDKIKKAVSILNASPGRWTNIKETLKQMLIPAEEIKLCLQSAGAAHKLSDISCSKKYFIDVASHSYQIRERFTVLDLAILIGLKQKTFTEIIEKFLIK